MRRELDLTVYLVLDPDLCGGIDGMCRVTESALEGGVTLVQLRAPQWKKRQWVDAARALLPLCRCANVPLLINDQVDVALAVDADGVHVGQQDLPAAEARRLLGPSRIVGLSASNAAQLAAVDAGVVDYVGVGPVYPTGTKPDASPVIGLAGFGELMRQKTLPAVAIGGIGPANAAAVYAAGADGIAVVSAICAAADPRAAAAALRALSHVSVTPSASES